MKKGSCFWVTEAKIRGVGLAGARGSRKREGFTRFLFFHSFFHSFLSVAIVVLFFKVLIPVPHSYGIMVEAVGNAEESPRGHRQWSCTRYLYVRAEPLRRNLQAAGRLGWMLEARGDSGSLEVSQEWWWCSQ